MFLQNHIILLQFKVNHLWDNLLFNHQVAFQLNHITLLLFQDNHLWDNLLFSLQPFLLNLIILLQSQDNLMVQ